MSLENWASNRWLEKLGSDREEIERLLARMRTGISTTIERRSRAKCLPMRN